ncbi:MAG: DNA-processing protein DprA [Acidobacteria bacterium]|nr:DNA-processing protein DprA [Acidobacteriota bacterium]
MSKPLSLNTQAILLLTAPLLAGRNGDMPKLLTPGEYNRLMRHLRDLHQQPSDLLSGDGALLSACQPVLDESRLRRLLERGFLLSQAVERWQSRALWVISRADADYPRRLKVRLKEEAPAVLYGCGAARLLETGGLAVVGSRHVDDVLIDYTMAQGRLSAQAHQTIVSGGAKGIDQAAMRGALEAGGQACGVLADSLEKISLQREHRNPLLEERLVLISPYDPNAGFNVGHAMQRNKLIYALADAALVVNSDYEKGGTWAGAVEQLTKLRLVPVYARVSGETGKGLLALRQKGALPWPDPQTADEFIATLDVAGPLEVAPLSPPASVFAVPPVTPLPKESLLPAKPNRKAAKPAPPTLPPLSGAGEMLFAKVRELLLQMLADPRTEAETAADLNVSKGQVHEWLQRLVAEGALKKVHKPIKYQVNVQRSLLE